MTIKSLQKVIRIGSSAGITIPARDLKFANLKVGDEIEVTIRRPRPAAQTEDQAVIQAAKDILTRYKKDFDNLAQR